MIKNGPGTSILLCSFCSSTFHRQPKTSHDRESITPEVLALHLAKTHIAQKEKEFEDVTKQSSEWFGPDWGLKEFNKSHHPLMAIVSK